MKVGIESDAIIETALRNKMRIMLVSPPGFGKTASVERVCRKLGWKLIVLILPLDDPSTIRGYPVAPTNDGDDARHCLFDGMAQAFKATDPTVVFFDDCGQASESTLKSVMRIVQYGELDGRQLPDCVRLIFASNDVGHGAGVYGMIEPLKSKIQSIVHLETDAETVVQFGLDNGWPIWLCAFLRNSPDSLNTWKPEKSLRIAGSCPRGWNNVAQWDAIGVDDPEVWEGSVGKGDAIKAHAFKRLQNELPDIASILMDPDNAPIPEKPDCKYLVSMAISDQMTAQNFGQCLTYLKRLPKLFRAYSIKDAFRLQAGRMASGKLPKDYRNISSNRDFLVWAVSPDGKEIMGGGH